MKSNYTRIAMEVAAWVVFIVFPLLLFPSLRPYGMIGNLNPVLAGTLIIHTLLIVFYYLNCYYFLPKFYFPKKIQNYFLICIGYLLALILLLQTNKEFNPLPSPFFPYANVAFIITIVIRFILVFLLSLGVTSYTRLKKAEEEKLKAELSYLKSQINPHFLFNTLNSIYALTVKKSDFAPESVTKLASIMRYVIAEAAEDIVTLEKEISYLTAYIELEKLRLTSKVSLTYTVTGSMENKFISPLIFIPLVENAFKHGVSTTENSEINIKLDVVGNKLSLNITNTKVKREKLNSTGLGIDNVTKRLGLVYGGKHLLEIRENENNFIVNLDLILNA